MQLIIDETAFRRLTPATQKEIVEALSGAEGISRVRAGKSAETGKTRSNWRRPVDLTPRMAAKLVSHLTEVHRLRLKLFTRKNGRVSMRELLAVTGDSDWHVISQFQGVVTRRLRRLMNDTEKKANLIGWDYDSTQWNDTRSEIVDGTYYVSEKTARALSTQF